MAKIILTLLFSQAFSASVYPGARTYLGEPAFDAFLSSYIPYLSSSLSSSTLPPSNLTLPFPFSHLKFSLFNTSVPNLILTPSQTKFLLTPSHTISLQIQNLNLTVTSDFNLTWHGLYHGNMSLSVTNANITLPITLSTQLATPSINIEKMKLTYTKSRFRFDSNNLFLTLIGYTNYIWPVTYLDEHLVWNAIKNLATVLNPQISKFFSGLNYMQVIGNSELALNYHFLQVEVTSPQSFEVGIAGGFLVPKNPFDVPPVLSMNASINWTSTTSFRVQLTDYFFNSYLWALSDAGYLNITVSGGTFPKYKGLLTTTGLRLIVPGLQETYGDNLNVIAYCGAGQYPTVSISNQKMLLSTNIVCNFVVTQSILVKPGFTLMFNAMTSVSSQIQYDEFGMFLMYQLNPDDAVLSDFTVPSSAIGVVDVGPLESALNFGVADFISMINPEIGRKIIKVPIPEHLVLDKPSILAAERVIEIFGEAMFRF